VTRRVVVIGGGISGLAAAHALAGGGLEILLLEASDRAGGVIRTETRDGFLLELGPNTVRAAPELWRLVETLGLAPAVLLADARAPRYVDFGGALRPVPMSPAALLTTTLLSPAGKLRLLLEPFRPRGGSPAESVRDFFARRLGPEVADRLIEPFVGGVYAGRADRLSASAAFTAPVAWEREHGSLLRGALAARSARPRTASLPRGLVSFRGGLQTLPTALAVSLGARFRAGAAVEELAPDRGGWLVRAAGGEHRADAVILAVPAHRAAGLVSGFAPQAARALGGIPQPPVAVLHLAWHASALRRPLEGFGHLVAPASDRRILGAVWSSGLFPGRAPADMALLTVFLGGSRDPSALDLSDEELIAAATRDLEAQGLVRGEPRALRVTRWPSAIPQYEPGHEDRVAALAREEALWPGLAFAGNYREGVSVADAIRSGLGAAARMTAQGP